MSGISPVLSETFDDVYAAVQETERGRWFLDEYRARLRSEETKTVLSAIHKLESVVTSLPGQAPKSPELEKLKTAIKLAREQITSQIAPLSNESTKLSDEGQMFAALAKLSRQAFATEAPEALRQNVGKGIDVALQLVQDIDNELGFAPPPKAAEPPQRKGEVSITIKAKPTAEQQKFFQQDADVFAPPQNSDFKAPSKAGFDGMAKGAQLTINKVAAKPQQNEAIEAAPANRDTALHTPVAEPQADSENKPRIMIIRRKPEELMQVPLAEDEKSENAA